MPKRTQVRITGMDGSAEKNFIGARLGEAGGIPALTCNRVRPDRAASRNAQSVPRVPLPTGLAGQGARSFRAG
ncbi:hypothetical protein GCM10020256_16750 [Streptomyces thermocoprophilus]